MADTEIRPPSVDDIEHAPASLAEKGPVDWEKKFHEISQKFTEVTTKNGELLEENSRLRAAKRTGDALDELITPYADKSFKFMILYCLFVGELLLMHGLALGFSLPESVLQLLVGTTAVTVIGLVGMVLTGIFVGARHGK